MSSKNKNYVSIWFWMFAVVVLAIPCVGFVMLFVWAFVGDNESRKNYFKALIAWMAILAVISLGLLLLGLWPQIVQWAHEHLPKPKR